MDPFLDVSNRMLLEVEKKNKLFCPGNEHLLLHNFFDRSLGCEADVWHATTNYRCFIYYYLGVPCSSRPKKFTMKSVNNIALKFLWIFGPHQIRNTTCDMMMMVPDLNLLYLGKNALGWGIARKKTVINYVRAQLVCLLGVSREEHREGGIAQTHPLIHSPISSLFGAISAACMHTCIIHTSRYLQHFTRTNTAAVTLVGIVSGCPLLAAVKTIGTPSPCLVVCVCSLHSPMISFGFVACLHYLPFPTGIYLFSCNYYVEVLHICCYNSGSNLLLQSMPSHVPFECIGAPQIWHPEGYYILSNEHPYTPHSFSELRKFEGFRTQQLLIWNTRSILNFRRNWQGRRRGS